MSFRNTFAGALSFAHLAGLARGKKTNADDDEEMKVAEKEPEDEPEDQEDEQEEDNQDESDNSGGKKGKKKKTKKTKKAKGAKEKPEDETDNDDDGDNGDEDEDEDGDEEAKKAKAEGRRLEKARCSKIFNSPGAARNIRLAARLAFNTSMSSNAVIALLEETGSSASRPSGLSDRMGDRSNPKVGPGGEKTQNSPQAIDASWDHAMKDFHPSR